MQIDPVVIVGGGPCGLSAAFFLSRRGVPVIVLEQSPTLEIFVEGGITDRLHQLGIVTRYWQFRGRAEGLVAEFDLEILRDITPFPYRMQCEQHKLVRILYEALQTSENVEFRFGAVVEGVRQTADGAEVLTSQGPVRASYVIGADGGRSVVRKSQAIDFAGFTYPERFLVVTTTHDYEQQGFAYSNYVSDPDRWAGIFKVPGPKPPGLWRAVTPTEPNEPEGPLLDFGSAAQRLQALYPKDEPYEVVHTNLYAVHQRVAETFRKGRVMLIGDAAHVNNPLGGMGMNFGIHDAFSMSEKLARVWHGENAALLDLFDRQRRHVAKAFLQTMSINNKQILEEKDPVARDRRLDDMRETAADPARARAYLLRTSMIQSVREAAEIV